MRRGCPASAGTEWHRCSGTCHLDATRCSPSRADVAALMSRPLGGVMSQESVFPTPDCLFPTPDCLGPGRRSEPAERR